MRRIYAKEKYHCKFTRSLEKAVFGAHLAHMKQRDDIPYLDGQLLVAMPGMGDPRFERTVIFVCVHSSKGAMGLIINRPANDLSVADLMDQLEIQANDPVPLGKVHFGGPVENVRGFVLHSGDYGDPNATMKVSDQFGMTASLDILKDMAGGKGPTNAILALGYSGWGPGQLESEIQANGWLTCAANSEIVFQKKDDDKWTAALKSIGIDPRLLSTEGGRA
jgi:putative transcriptional regulator